MSLHKGSPTAQPGGLDKEDFWSEGNMMHENNQEWRE